MAENRNSPPNEGEITVDPSDSTNSSRRRSSGRNHKKNRYRKNDPSKNSTFKGPLAGYETYIYNIP